MSDNQEQTHAHADRFIRLYAQPRQSGRARIYRWFHVDSIDEICDTDPRPRLPAEGDGEKIPMVFIRMHGGHSGGHPYWLEADGTAAEVTASIVAMRAAGAATDAAALAEALKPLLAAPAPPPHAVNDRGEWTSGERYAPLDYVTHPDTAAGHLCMASNKSSSAGVLANTKFWCRLDLPEAI